MWAGLHVKIIFSICTGYDVIIVCPYVINHQLYACAQNHDGVHDISPILPHVLAESTHIVQVAKTDWPGICR